MRERQFQSINLIINSFLIWTADFIALLNIIFMYILYKTISAYSSIICNKVLFYTISSLLNWILFRIILYLSCQTHDTKNVEIFWSGLLTFWKLEKKILRTLVFSPGELNLLQQRCKWEDLVFYFIF